MESNPANVEPVSTVGVIGLGVMGRPMARRLIAAGFDVVVHSRTLAAIEALTGAGARLAATPADVAAQSEVVVVMVPDASDVEAILDGQDGLLAGAAPGLIVLAMGTHHPAAMPPLARRCAEHGVALLDAPVSGGQEGAEAGTLSIMVGGDPTSFQRAQAVLGAMGETIVHVGPSGAGQMVKACNQLIVGATIAAVAEGLTLARVAGLDPGVVRSAISGGYAKSRVLDIHGGRMVRRDFVPGGRAALHAKDAHIILDAAGDLRLALPVFSVVAAAFDELVARGDGDLDHSALITLLEGDASRLP